MPCTGYKALSVQAHYLQGFSILSFPRTLTHTDRASPDLSFHIECNNKGLVRCVYFTISYTCFQMQLAKCTQGQTCQVSLPFWKKMHWRVKSWWHQGRLWPGDRRAKLATKTNHVHLIELLYVEEGRLYIPLRLWWTMSSNLNKCGWLAGGMY